jgi:hypothetical protein
MRGAHKTRTEIARRLDDIAPRPNGGRWVPKSVERLIKNRVYMGEAYRGEAINPNAHEAIVTSAEWQAANLAPVRASPRGKRPNLLGGIVRCTACRYVLAPQVSGGSRSNPTPVYRCREMHSAGACPAPAAITREAVERYVESLWREQMADQALLLKQDSQAVKTATEELEAAEEELRAFASDLTARRLLGNDYHAALEARVSAVNRAQTELQQVNGPALDAGTIARYDELPIEDRKRILGSSIDAVFVKRGDARMPVEKRVTILWRGEGPNDLPRRGRDNGPVRAYIP